MLKCLYFLTSQFSDDDNGGDGNTLSPDFFDDAPDDLEHEEPNGSISQGETSGRISSRDQEFIHF